MGSKWFASSFYLKGWIIYLIIQELTYFNAVKLQNKLPINIIKEDNFKCVKEYLSDNIASKIQL